MIYIFLVFYSILCYLTIDIIPLNLIINGYIYIIAMYFLFPYIVRLFIKKTTTKIEYNSTLKTDVYITKALIVRGAMSIYLPFHKKPLYAISEKSYDKLTTEEIDFLTFHEHAHIVYKDQRNNMISFFTVLYVNPIILTFISTNIFIKNYLYTYLVIAVVIYVTAFTYYFVFTRKKELRADHFAAEKTNFKIAASALKKLYNIKEMREKTFNILATHPSCKSRISSLEKH